MSGKTISDSSCRICRGKMASALVSKCTFGITCDGVIAANDVNAGDYFYIGIKATHIFTTEMEDDGVGMIRLDAYIDDGEFAELGNNAVTMYANNYINDECDNEEAVNVEGYGESTLTGLTVDGDSFDDSYDDGVWHQFYKIITSAASEDNPKQCEVFQYLIMKVTLPESLSPDEDIDLSFARGDKSIKMGASMCANQSTCAKFLNF